MKQTYTIKEIATMLGIGIDAIRFYEKKGLVHPQQNPNNRYRQYTMHNILELLDVIYYRELDLSIADITEIFQTNTKETMKQLLEEKRKNAEKRIRYERQLIKKIQYIEAVYQMIEEHKGISLKQFPKTCILSRSSEKEEIMRSQMMELTKAQFVMSSLYSTYDIDQGNMQDLFITMEQSLMKEFGLQGKLRDKLSLGTCIYTVVQLKGAQLQKEQVAPLLAYAKKHARSYGSLLYVHEIPLTSYIDENNYYAELYLPCTI